MLRHKIILGIAIAQSFVILVLYLEIKITDIFPVESFETIPPVFSCTSQNIQDPNNNNNNDSTTNFITDPFHFYNLTHYYGSLWPMKKFPPKYFFNPWTWATPGIEKEKYACQAYKNNRLFQLISYGLEASKNNYSSFNVTRKKLIFVRNKRPGIPVYEEFVSQSSFCFKNSACELTNDTALIPNASAVVNLNYEDKVVAGIRSRMREDQIYIASTMESPSWFSGGYPKPKFDSRVWIVNYRSDSDIVSRYYVWIYFNPRVRQKEQDVDYAEAGKTKLVMALISNCPSRNRRMEYVLALSKFIPVDIYGKAGKNPIPENSTIVMEKLSTYKFFLAFENSNCREYITEKVFSNSFRANAIPIVLGAHPEDYENQLPENSYILLQNYKSAEELGAYLNYLDKNETAYNEYFQWKGTGQFIHSGKYFLCTLCSMLFYDEQIEKKPLSNSKEYTFDYWNEHMADGTKACKPKRKGRNLCGTPGNSSTRTEKFLPWNEKHIVW